MLLVYASKTGNVERFVQKFPLSHLKIASGNEHVFEPCVLVTYTTGLGEIPPEVERFAQTHQQWIRGVAVSGNRNWGKTYAQAAMTLHERYGFPIVHTFELSGTRHDTNTFLEGVNALEH